MIFDYFSAIFYCFHDYFATWSKYFATWDLFRASGALPWQRAWNHFAPLEQPSGPVIRKSDRAVIPF